MSHDHNPKCWLHPDEAGSLQQRSGFTPRRLLSADRRAVGTVASAVQRFEARFPKASQTSSSFEPGGGGRSGGGGSDGEF